MLHETLCRVFSINGSLACGEVAIGPGLIDRDPHASPPPPSPSDRAQRASSTRRHLTMRYMLRCQYTSLVSLDRRARGVSALRLAGKLIHFAPTSGSAVADSSAFHPSRCTSLSLLMVMFSFRYILTYECIYCTTLRSPTCMRSWQRASTKRSIANIFQPDMS